MKLRLQEVINRMGFNFVKKENFKVPVRISVSIDYTLSKKIKDYSRKYYGNSQSDFLKQAVNDLLEKLDRENKETGK